MTYNEFTNNQIYTNIIHNVWNPSLSTFLQYLKNRYGHRELLYGVTYTANFINRIILDYYYDLKKAQQSAQIVTTTNITKQELGYKSQNTGNTTNNASATDTTSYMGYNVDSDYNRQKSINEITSNTTHTNTNLNLVAELQNYVGVNMDAYYDNIATQISVLFRRIY